MWFAMYPGFPVDCRLPWLATLSESENVGAGVMCWGLKGSYLGTIPQDLRRPALALLAIW